MERHGRDVANFLAAVGVTDVVLIGGSMGASTCEPSCRSTRRRRW
ncbi:alpha/beta fold hydrolase [Rhodococcus sp. IEGM 1330]